MKPDFRKSSVKILELCIMFVQFYFLKKRTFFIQNNIQSHLQQLYKVCEYTIIIKKEINNTNNSLNEISKIQLRLH